jgi:hypothetical protein
MKRSISFVLMLAAFFAVGVIAVSCNNAEEAVVSKSSTLSKSQNAERGEYGEMDAIEQILKDVDPDSYRLELGQLPENSLVKKSSYGSLSYDKIIELDKEKITIEKLIRKYPPALRGCFDIYNLEKIKRILEKIAPDRYKGLAIQKTSRESGILVRELDQVEQLFQEVDLRNYRLDFGKIQTNRLVKQTSYGAYPLEKLDQIYSERGYGSQFDYDWDIDICPPHRTTIRIYRWVDFDKFKNLLINVDERFKATKIDQISQEELIMIPEIRK